MEAETEKRKWRSKTVATTEVSRTAISNAFFMAPYYRKVDALYSSVRKGELIRNQRYREWQDLRDSHEILITRFRSIRDDLFEM
jgi:hypothetical protein